VKKDIRDTIVEHARVEAAAAKALGGSWGLDLRDGWEAVASLIESARQVSCACGWKGQLFTGPDAERLARAEAVAHLAKEDQGAHHSEFPE